MARRVNERAWRGERQCVRAVCGEGDVCAVGTGETVDERRRGKGRWV